MKYIHRSNAGCPKTNSAVAQWGMLFRVFRQLGRSTYEFGGATICYARCTPYTRAMPPTTSVAVAEKVNTASPGQLAFADETEPASPSCQRHRAQWGHGYSGTGTGTGATVRRTSCLVRGLAHERRVQNKSAGARCKILVEITAAASSANVWPRLASLLIRELPEGDREHGSARGDSVAQ